MVVLTAPPLTRDFEPYRKYLCAMLEDAAAVCAESKKIKAEARRIRRVSELKRQAATERRRIH
jgi:hypothetical protein